MAASSNPPENNHEGSSSAAQKASSSSAAAATKTNGVAVDSVDNGGDKRGAAGNSQTISSLKHNPGISVDWTHEEQSLLEDLLTKYASEATIVRYAKIAMKMKDKTVRDIALRCRWMTKKENGKRRKDEHSSRKSKDKKEKATDSPAKSSSHLNVHPNGPSYTTTPMMSMDTDDGISYKDIGGVSGDLLEQNAQMFNQVSSNLSAFQIHENVNMLSKARDNILTILNDLNDMPEVMKQMPPLPVKINEELANTILSRPSTKKKS